MVRALRVVNAVLFWVVQVWWLGHVVMALRYAADGGTFRVYSVVSDGVHHDAWGLTFAGAPGLVRAITYLVVVVMALLGLAIARRTTWIVAATILLAWALLFAGNSLWMSRWDRLAWWDWVNFAGFVVVAVQIGRGWRQRGRPIPSPPAS